MHETVNNKSEQVWIALDLDKTLAHGLKEDKHTGNVGPPIELMVRRVQSWLNQGFKVTIFTARLSDVDKDGTTRSTEHHIDQCQKIWKFLEEAGLPKLEITAIKRPYFTHFVDDKAVPVKLNEGEIIFDITHKL